MVIDGLCDRCTVAIEHECRYPTATGSECTVPIDDDSGADGSGYVSENVASDTTADIVFAGLSFAKCPTIRSGFIRVPLELLQDSTPKIRTQLAPLFDRRVARTAGLAAVTALLADADTTTAAATNAITLDEVLSLMGDLHGGYFPAASFAMNPATYIALLQLKASTGGGYMIEAERDAQGFPLLVGARVFCPRISRR